LAVYSERLYKKLPENLTTTLNFLSNIVPTQSGANAI